jgi:hypothetical protein
MTEQNEIVGDGKRRDIVAIFERLFDSYKDGEISREKAADTVVNVIDALRNKEPADDEEWYNDLLYLLAILGLC